MEAHLLGHDNLEEFSDPANYDIEDSSDTGIAFYIDIAKETGSPILEIGCGTGRVSIPMARMGFTVTGLDPVPGMLALARQKSKGLSIDWVQGDGRTFRLSERFRLIFLTGNAFQLFLTREDQEALLSRAKEHLDAGGLLAFESRNPRWRKVANAYRTARTRGFPLLESSKRQQPWGSYIDKDGRKVSVSRTQDYDHVAQVLHWTSYRKWWEGSQRQTKVARIALRYTFPQEMEGLLCHNGFAIVHLYGDWNREPLSQDSPSIIVVCRKLS